MGMPLLPLRYSSVGLPTLRDVTIFFEAKKSPKKGFSREASGLSLVQNNKLLKTETVIKDKNHYQIA
ncbi:hypothetical protein FFWV33_11350 [Flavobacterium faecale]|uniref:Uncharacterized protein n=1 Tax=Flavobacterium faecale TaxID=1355330 RepID=A0A2S1LE86_9FLAO|nr:hypothetical protein FFWV33_11350 [Flavobacterium faecale]